jgi:hypothetical protein
MPLHYEELLAVLFVVLAANTRFFFLFVNRMLYMIQTFNEQSDHNKSLGDFLPVQFRAEVS